MTVANPSKVVSAVLIDGKTMIRQADGTLHEADGRTDWTRLAALSDAEIEAAAQTDTEAPPADDEFWRTAPIVVLEPRLAKWQQEMRLDAEVIDWFKGQGPGWQTRMNAVLKSYVDAHKKQRPQ